MVDDTLLRRLTGAAVLVTAALAVSALLPDPDPGFVAASGESRTVRYDLGATASPAPVPQRVAPATVPATANDPDDGTRLQLARRLQRPDPEATGESAAGNEPAVQGRQRSAQPSPKSPPPNSAPQAEAATVTGGWVVQVGSFGEEHNAQALALQLRKQTLPVAVSAVRSGARTLHRVRVGPYADRDQAGQVLRRLQADGWRDAAVMAAP